MIANSFLTDLLQKGLALWVENGELCFRARRGILTPSLRKELAERKDELVAILSERRKYVIASFAQQRWWVLDQFETAGLAYNLFSAIRMTGSLNVAALEQSLNQIIRRHEVLRTAFATVDGQPAQVIAPALTVRLPVVSLQEIPETEREAYARRLVTEEARYSFDLTQHPLFRTSLLRLGEKEHVLFLDVHHIIFDGLSARIFARELAALYEAFLDGKSSPLPELPIQYADFTQWQRQSLQAGDLKEALVYWKQQLAAPLPIFELVTDHSHPTIAASETTRQMCTLDKPLTEELKALSRRERVTLFVTMLAALKALLHRFTSQTDIIVGSPVADRNRTEIEGMIGLFLNALVLRTDLSGDPTFIELLGRVRQVVVEAFAHKELPFERLVQELRPGRDWNRNPLFQVVFNLQNLPTVSLELPNLRVSLLAPDFEQDEEPDMLGMAIKDTKEGMVCIVEHRRDILNQDILGHFQTLLQGVVSNPNQRLSALPLLTEAERHQLLVTWNDTQASYPQEQCFPQLFEAQVECTPDSIAAVCGDAHFTYRQLNQRANRLASILVGHNIGPDTVVALLAERGLDFLTTILAVFKAGGSYLPLDPRYPAQRLHQVLKQSQSPLILVADECVPVLSDALASLPFETHPVILHLSQVLPQGQSTDNLPARCTPRNLAYVIYTSGSTGIPKGAMIEQRGMVNHLYAKIRDLQLTDADIVAQNASQSFDISVWQFLASLLVGGRVEIFTDETAYDPVRLLEQVSSRRVTILEIVPSLLRAMLEQIAQSDLDQLDLTALRWLMPTGEALAPELARQWLTYYPNSALINAYGPTECSDDVTHGPIVQPPAVEAFRIPIGRPIANLRLYVLDPQLQPVPVGVAGELHVGGVGVGRGYLHEPQKTTQAFIPDPFSSEPSARLYKTGDLACYRSDGVLEFLGRVDYQVKVRGFRIELGEIEAVLERHPAVRQAVAMVREDTPGEQHLVAYVVPGQEQALTPGDLRDLLREQLPDYMVPSAFVLLGALPLTPNGKVDRRALPAPDTSQLARLAEFVAPETPLEKRLAEIWTEVLGIEQIGIYDDFFDLGGHSLIATQLIYRINKVFGVNLSVRKLFLTESNIANLALLVEETLIEMLEERARRRASEATGSTEGAYA